MNVIGFPLRKVRNTIHNDIDKVRGGVPAHKLCVNSIIASPTTPMKTPEFGKIKQNFCKKCEKTFAFVSITIYFLKEKFHIL